MEAVRHGGRLAHFHAAISTTTTAPTAFIDAS